MSIEPFVAEICIFGCNFAPTGWAQCNGQLLPIAQNTALFSLLGTTYGGNGQSTFALPDLQGGTPIQAGQGPGLSGRLLGESGGSESSTLVDAELPAHAHVLQGTGDIANSNDPAGRVLARPFGGGNLYKSGGAATTMAPESSALAGGGLPHENRQPYLVLNFCIALQGVLPQRP